MGELRRCAYGGRAVGDFLDVPGDPTRYYHPAGEEFGCSHLVCGACGARVRQAPGFGGKSDVTPRRLRELYLAPDWSALPWLEPIAARLYACRCTTWLESSSHYMEDPQPEWTDPTFPWRCAGHPVPTLPAAMDGVAIEPGMDFEPLVRRVFSGWVPEAAAARRSQYRTWPVCWIRTLYAWLAGLPECDALSWEAATCVWSDEPGLRGSALHFLRRFPRAAGFVDALEFAAEHQPDIGRSWSTVGDDQHRFETTVLEVLLARLATVGSESDEDDRRTLDVLRCLPLTSPHGGGGGLLDLVAKADGHWLATHVEQIEAAWPGRWEAVLEGLRHSGQAELVVLAGVAIARATGVPSADVRRWLELPQNKYGAHGPVIQAALRKRTM